MKPNKWILLSITAVVIACAVKVYAGNLAMTTYYPAPTGYYDAVKVNVSLIVPCYDSDKSPATARPTTVGAVWIESTDDSCR